MRPSSRSDGGGSGPTRSIVDAIVEPCAARAGHPGALVSAGSSSQRKIDGPEPADRRAGEPVAALDDIRAREPRVGERADCEPERLARAARAR